MQTNFSLLPPIADSARWRGQMRPTAPDFKALNETARSDFARIRAGLPEAELPKNIAVIEAENKARAKARQAEEGAAAAKNGETPKNESAFSERALNPNEDAASVQLVKAEDMSLRDLAIGLNPLQHIPIVGSVYRAMTGQETSGTLRVMGSYVLGGPVGLLMGIGTQIFAQEHGGQEPGDVLLAKLIGKDKTTGVDDDTPQPQTAQTDDETASDTDDLADDDSADDAGAQNIAALPKTFDETPFIDNAAPAAPASAMELGKEPMPAIPVTTAPLDNKPLSPNTIRPAYDLGPITPAPASAMPELMQRGLDKYEALIKERLAR